MEQQKSRLNRAIELAKQLVNSVYLEMDNYTLDDYLSIFDNQTLRNLLDRMDTEDLRKFHITLTKWAGKRGIYKPDWSDKGKDKLSSAGWNVDKIEELISNDETGVMERLIFNLISQKRP